MAKKSVSKHRKEVISQIQEQIDNGVPKKEIFDKLNEDYFDKSTILNLVASAIDSKTKSKYKGLNNTLLGLLVFTILLKVLFGIILVTQLSIYALPAILILPLVNVYFAFEVSRYTGYIYRILGLLTIAGMMQTVSRHEGDIILLLIDLGIGATIAGLSFYLGSKMFPNFGFFGVKKDEEGNPILD